MGRVSGKVAIITGGGSAGMGRATSLLLAQEGASVVVGDINEAGAKETADLINVAGGKAVSMRHDVSSEDDWAAVVKLAVDTYGRIDILDNNAAMFIAKPLMNTSTEEFRLQNSINVDGVFFGMKAVIPVMEKTGGGAIVNISSGAGIVGFAAAGAYSSSKGAVRLMTKSMALECAEKKNKVRVNSIHPGPILTPMLEQGMDDLGGGADIRGMFEAMAPVGYLGEPQDIAQGVLYLASDESKYVTGAELAIDGGFIAQ
ncbi:MAG: glucose 1-dehydrogenase [Porticoccaceae bacterium]|nr:glucose 1-dehydrogenase [Porticoccaceae bacterium]